MSRCDKCGNTEGLKVQSGTAKSGRKWKGLRCKCGNLTFIPIDTIPIEEHEENLKEVNAVKDEMTPDMWFEKEQRDHRRRIMLSLISTYPDVASKDITTLKDMANIILEFVNEG